MIIVRVELHNEDDYDEFHEEMEKRGFVRTIASVGNSYQLPAGTYRYTGRLQDLKDVRTLVIAAVKACSLIDAEILTMNVSDFDTWLRSA